MPKPASDKSSAGICPHLECISDKRRTVLRITLAAFAVLLVLSLAAAPVSAAWDGTNDTDWYGDGSASSFTISTEKQLAGLAFLVNDGNNFTGKTITLTADLNLLKSDGYNNQWTPIGIDGKPFKGTFDGNNNTISNLYVIPSSDGRGLFKYTQNANIKNLGLINVDVIGTSDVGGLVAGISGGNITNCYATGKVTGGSRVGGLVGSNDGGTITKCYAAVAVTGTSNVGGLVGGYSVGDTTKITNSYATGTVTGGNNVGGLVGIIVGTIENCYATGEVKGDSPVGGLVGSLGGSVTNSTVLNPSVIGSSNVGRVVGNDGTITNCYAWDKMTGGFGTISNDKNDKNGESKSSSEIWNNISSGSVWSLANFDTTNNWSLNSGNEYYKLPVVVKDSAGLRADTVSDAAHLCPIGGTGTEDDAYQISNPIQLHGLALLVNANNTNYNAVDKYYEVTADIDLSSVCGAGIGDWTPIGTESNPFKGTFNGTLHTISHLYINSTSYLGLFGYTDSGATIKYLGVTGEVTGKNQVGGLVGYNSGTIDNCYTAVTVRGDHAGGLVGENTGTINISAAISPVEGIGDSVGGLVGLNSGTIANCYANKTVTSTGDYVGGLVGKNEANLGTVSITNCYATGTVTGNTSVGGLVGKNEANLGTVSITNCYATGNVTVTGDNYVGGLVGYNYAYSGTAKITNCYATGKVEGTVTGDYVGGLVGKNEANSETAKITNSTALNPSVNGSSNVSRVVGYNEDGTISDNYAWEGISGTWINDKNGKDGANASSLDVWANLTFYQNSLGWGSNISIESGSAVWKINNGGYTVNDWAVPYLIIKPLDIRPILHLKPAVYTVYNVTFNSTTGTGTMANQSFVSGVDQALNTNTFTKSGYTFDGWNKTSADGKNIDYTDGQTINISSDITLYAVWKENSTPTPAPTRPSSGGSTDTGSGNFNEYPRTVTNGGEVTFGSSPTVSSVDLPEGVSGSVMLVVKSDAQVPGDMPTYTVFEINIPNYPEGEEAVILFKITLAELEKAGYNPEDICLYHCDENGVWTALPTTFTIIDGVVYYESITTAFSPFAVVFEENGATEVGQPVVTPVKTQTPEPVQTYVEPTKTAVPTPEQTKSPVGLVGLGLGLLGAALVLRRK